MSKIQPKSVAKRKKLTWWKSQNSPWKMTIVHYKNSCIHKGTRICTSCDLLFNVYGEDRFSYDEPELQPGWMLIFMCPKCNTRIEKTEGPSVYDILGLRERPSLPRVQPGERPGLFSSTREQQGVLSIHQKLNEADNRSGHKSIHIDLETGKLTIKEPIGCSYSWRSRPCGWHVSIVDGIASDV